ncbi:MAG: hypothetical protein Q7J15_02740 [Candidatus Desulfaltia sp.]|nr:hypothetical protein [Candidatus Desulfaltia sp.]
MTPKPTPKPSFIEKAGTGIRRMRDGARERGYPEPEFSADTFFIAVSRPIPAVSKKDTLQVTPEGTWSSRD